MRFRAQPWALEFGLQNLAAGHPLTAGASHADGADPQRRALLDPMRLLSTLWRARWGVLACGIAGAAAAFLGARQLPARYTAEAILVVEMDRLMPELQGAVSKDSAQDPLPRVRTEVQVLRSPALMQTIIRERELDRLPEFNPALRPPGVADQLLAFARPLVTALGFGQPVTERERDQRVLARALDALSITHDNRSLAIVVSFTARDTELAAQVANDVVRHYLDDKLNERARTNREAYAALTRRAAEVRADVDDLERRVRETRVRESLIELRAGSVGQQQVEELAIALARALDALAITHDNRSLAIVVNFTARDAELAAQVTNDVVRHYLDDKLNERARTNREAHAALTRRAAEVRADVDELERRVRETRVRESLIELRAGSVGQQQVEELAIALSRVQANRAQVETDFERASSLAASGRVTELASVVGAQTISALRAREVEAARNAAEMGSRFGRGHPDFRRVELELAAIRAEIMLEARRVVASLGAQAETVRRHEAELLRRLGEAREVATESGSRRAELEELQKEADARRLLYNSLLERAERTAVEPGPLHQLHPGARIVSAAVAPGVPSSPRPALAGAVGLAGGLAMGGLLALAGGRRSFARREDLQERIGIPALAAVPRAPSGGLVKAIALRRNGPEAEALRLLRNGLRFAGRGGTRVVLFVGTAKGEGASGMAAAYARLAALDGIDTLLLEGDLRQPALATLLGANGGKNLVRVLEGRGGWRDAVGKDPASPLHILLAEQPQDASYRLLDRHQLQNLLRDAAEDYRLIVLDAPAIAAAPDALLLVRHADAVCLVVAAGATGEAAVRDAVDRLRLASTAQLAAVLNRAG